MACFVIFCIIVLIYVDHAQYWRNTILALLFQVISEDWGARDRALDGEGGRGDYITESRYPCLLYSKNR